MNTSAAPSVNSLQPSRALHYTLWTAQFLLAIAFIAAGSMKVALPIEALAQQMGWPGVVPAALVRFIGSAELLGGLGLVLPALTRIKPGLTVWAALGLTTVMLLALLFHLNRGEFSLMPINVVLGSLTAVIAWGRWRRAPIAAR